VKTALLTIAVYLIALPFVFFAGAGFIAFFIATAWLLGREYFELAAMRFRTPAEAKAMRQANGMTVFTGGLIIAAFVSIPIVNLATPLFGMAFMVHLHKKLSGPRPELIEPARHAQMPVV
ncbi:MAG: EI24 domain-containing protein, partial [Tardiphaga sp.]